MDSSHAFQHSDQHLDEFLGSLDKFSEESKMDLVRPLAEGGEDGLQRCQSGKAPGLDGLLYKFFKYSWSVIGSDFF